MRAASPRHTAEVVRKRGVLDTQVALPRPNAALFCCNASITPVFRTFYCSYNRSYLLVLVFAPERWESHAKSTAPRHAISGIREIR